MYCLCLLLCYRVDIGLWRSVGSTVPSTGPTSHLSWRESTTVLRYPLSHLASVCGRQYYYTDVIMSSVAVTLKALRCFFIVIWSYINDYYDYYENIFNHLLVLFLSGPRCHQHTPTRGIWPNHRGWWSPSDPSLWPHIHQPHSTSCVSPHFPQFFLTAGSALSGPEFHPCTPTAH